MCLHVFKENINNKFYHPTARFLSKSPKKKRKKMQGGEQKIVASLLIWSRPGLI
jgi:hypothetical protein